MPLRKIWINFSELMKNVWNTMCWGLTEVAVSAWYGVRESWSAAVFWLKSIVTDLKAGLSAVWYGLCDGLCSAWDKAWAAIIRSFRKSVAWLMEKWIKVKGFFGADVAEDLAELRNYNAETTAGDNARRQAAASASARRQAESDARKAAYRQEAEDDRRQRSDEKLAHTTALERARDANDKKLLDGFAENGADARQELANAQKDLADALARRDASIRKAADHPEREAAGSIPGNTAAAVTAAGISESGRKGAFTLAALTGTAGDAQDRTAKATERTLGTVEDILKWMKTNGGKMKAS